MTHVPEILLLLVTAFAMGRLWERHLALRQRFKDYLEGLGDREPEPMPEHLDSVDTATLNYHVSMAFVEGSTLQDITAAGASSVAIWAARCADTHGLDQTTIEQGRYRVETEITVKYEPLADDESAVPIFDGAKLVRMLEGSQRG
jgi:hypothetical protein